MALTLLSAVAWWYSRNTRDWQVAPARVLGLSLIENDRQFSAARPQIQMHYCYAVGGMLYHGTARLDPVTRTLYRALPREVQILLREKGYMSFNDLPPAVQAILKRRGIERFDAVPAPLLDTLRAQGFRSVKDFPADLKRMAAAGDYERAAREFELRYGGAAPYRWYAGGSPGAPSVPAPALPAFPSEYVAPLQTSGVIMIRYDPDDPEEHRIFRFPRLERLPGALLFAISAGFSLVYCGLVYPYLGGR